MGAPDVIPRSYTVKEGIVIMGGEAERLEDAMLLTLKMKTRARSQGMRPLWEAGKGKGFSPGASTHNTVALTPWFSL